VESVPALVPLLEWYATLSPASLTRIGEFYRQDARFRDPFNAVQGLAAIEAIFAHMFVATQAPRFVITDALGEGARAYARWDFHFALRGRPYVIHGATRFAFDAQGRVSEHRDYWDPAEELWQKLPLIGGPTAWLRRRFSAG